MRKSMSLVSAILLLLVASWGNAGGCFDSVPDFDDCNVRGEQGDVASQLLLAMTYEGGTPQDHKTAVYWYTKAAKQGNAMAQLALGIMYYEGRGAPKDYVMAHMLWNMSAVQGNKNAAEMSGSITKLMTPAKIEQSHRQAREWVSNQNKI